MSDERTNEELAFQATSTRLEGWERVQAVKELTRRANEATVLRRALDNMSKDYMREHCDNCTIGGCNSKQMESCSSGNTTAYIEEARKELGC